LNEGAAEDPETLFPLPAMRSCIPPESVMDAEVCDFMDIGYQEEKRRAVGVDCDARRAAGAAGEIPEFCCAASPELELKRSLLPKTQAIGHGRPGNMSGEEGGEFGGLHRPRWP
jgi:hypothetical protein